MMHIKNIILNVMEKTQEISKEFIIETVQCKLTDALTHIKYNIYIIHSVYCVFNFNDYIIMRMR